MEKNSKTEREWDWKKLRLRWKNKKEGWTWKAWQIGLISLYFFPSPSLLPPVFLHLFYSQRGLPQPRKKSARSELADPSVGWLIAEVSLCQMTNRVSLPITNLPAGAPPWFVYFALKQGNTQTHPPFYFLPNTISHSQSVRWEKCQ